MDITQQLERVRAVLRRRRTPGRHSSAHVPQEVPQTLPAPPRPDVLGARLVVARRHRPGPAQASQAQPRAEWFPLRPWEDTGSLVRPFVAHLGDPPRNANPRPHADSWGRVQ
jgi:hypothetical protein